MFALVACREPVPPSLPDFGYDYFPLATGMRWEYRVDSVIIDPASRPLRRDTLTRYWREIITDRYVDPVGDTVYRVQRWQRASLSDSWQPFDWLTLARSDRQAFRTEQNRRFIPLVFPLRQAARWDGNRYFDAGQAEIVAGEPVQVYKNWEYELISLGQSWQGDERTFSRVAMVRMANYSGTVEQRRARAIFARDTGLVYRHLTILDTQCRQCCGGNTGPECQMLSWKEKAERGFILEQRLLQFQK